MKCPKCGYLGFDAVDRCRNCGYEFSLSDGAETLELPIRTAPSTIDPLADLAMIDAAIPAKATPSRSMASPELPLFALPPGGDPGEHDPQPRPHVVLRRAAIAATLPRRRHESSREQMLDLTIEPDVLVTRPASTSRAELDQPEEARDAGLVARFFAVVFDLAILAAIDAAVIYFTLAICGMTLAEFDLLPKGPLVVFLFVQNAGYLVAFTAGGQTLGKMLAGIKVVTDNSDVGLDLGRAALRTAVWVLLAVPAGLGFLTAIFNSDHRGLHDRFAQTRVVRG